MQTTTTITIAEFVTANKIRLTAKRVDRNPHMEDRDMDHWLCGLRCGSKVTSFHFSKGFGHHGKEPTAEELLDCLAGDASSIDSSRSFEEWADDLGYDTDSRKAERTYKAIQDSGAKLARFLGPELYQQLLYGTERL